MKTKLFWIFSDGDLRVNNKIVLKTVQRDIVVNIITIRDYIRTSVQVICKIKTEYFYLNFYF